MFTSTRQTRAHAHRIGAMAAIVQLTHERERARLEVARVLARYAGSGLADHEVPGIRSALGVFVSFKRRLALAEVELANA